MDDYHAQQRLASAIATRDVRELEAYVLGGGGGASHALDAQARYAYYTALFGAPDSAAPTLETSTNRFSASERKPAHSAKVPSAAHVLPATTRISLPTNRSLRETSGSLLGGVGLRQASAMPEVTPTEWTDADRRRHLIRALSPLHVDRVQQKCIVPYPRKHSRKDLWLKEHLMRDGNNSNGSDCVNADSSDGYAFTSRSAEDTMRREAERETFQYMCRTEAQARTILCKQEEYAFRGLLTLAGDDLEDNVIEVRKTRERVQLECVETRERRTIETAQMCAFQSCLSPFAALHLNDDFACECNRLAVAERSVRERVFGAELEERRRLLRLAVRDAKTVGLGLADVVEVHRFLLDVDGADDVAANFGAPDSTTRDASILRQPPHSTPAGLNSSAFSYEDMDARRHAGLSPQQHRALVQEAVRAERALRSVREQMIPSMVLHEKLCLMEEYNRYASDLQHVSQHVLDTNRMENPPRITGESSRSIVNESRWVSKYAKMYEKVTQSVSVTSEMTTKTTHKQPERAVQRTPNRTTRQHPLVHNTSSPPVMQPTPPSLRHRRHIPSPNVDIADSYHGSPLRRLDTKNELTASQAHHRRSVNQGTSTEGLLGYRPRVHPPIDPDQECTAF